MNDTKDLQLRITTLINALERVVNRQVDAELAKDSQNAQLYAEIARELRNELQQLQKIYDNQSNH